jgi:hypothetical protein
MNQRWPVSTTLSVSQEYNGLHMTWIDPEINGTMRSERLIIYATVSNGIGSYVSITYSNLHCKLLDGDVYKLCLELTSERQRFFQKSSVLWVTQLAIRLPLSITVSMFSVDSVQLPCLI